MFNEKRAEDDYSSNNKKIRTDWLNFASGAKQNSFMSSIAADNKFIQEDLKIRSIVIKILEREFGKSITQIRNYEFLVDSAVNRLKKKQLDAETD